MQRIIIVRLCEFLFLYNDPRTHAQDWFDSQTKIDFFDSIALTLQRWQRISMRQSYDESVK